MVELRAAANLGGVGLGNEGERLATGTRPLKQHVPLAAPRAHALAATAAFPKQTLGCRRIAMHAQVPRALAPSRPVLTNISRGKNSVLGSDQPIDLGQVPHA